MFNKFSTTYGKLPPATIFLLHSEDKKTNPYSTCYILYWASTTTWIKLSIFITIIIIRGNLIFRGICTFVNRPACSLIFLLVELKKSRVSESGILNLPC